MNAVAPPLANGILKLGEGLLVNTAPQVASNIVANTAPQIATKVAQETVSKGAASAGASIAGSTAAKVGGEVASKVLSRSLVAVSVVPSVVISAFEVGSLIKSWVKSPPTLENIDNMVKQLEKEIDAVKPFRKAIDSAKQEIYTSSIGGCQLIAADRTSIQLTEHFFELDFATLDAILKELGLYWPFYHLNLSNANHFAKFALKNKIASGLTTSQVEAFAKTRGKTAKKLITVTLTKLMEDVKKKNEDEKRSERGEHVINNGVLSVYKDIIDDFFFHFKKQFGYRLPESEITKIPELPAYSQMMKDYHHPLPKNIKKNIQYVMKAFIPNDVIYIDANALVYGIMIAVLRKAAVDHMKVLYDSDVEFRKTISGSEHKSKIDTSINYLNHNSICAFNDQNPIFGKLMEANKTKVFAALTNPNPIYVDFMALNYWLAQNGSPEMFVTSRNEVRLMFDNLYDKLKWWVRDFRNLREEIVKRRL